MKKKNFWVKVLSVDGGISSKRLITLIAMGLIVVGFLGNMIWKYSVDAGIVEAVEWIVLGGLGTTVAERFGKSKPDELDEPSEEPQ